MTSSDICLLGETYSYMTGGSGSSLGHGAVCSEVADTDAPMFKVKINGRSKTIKPEKTLSIKVAFKPTSRGQKSTNLK